MKPCLAVRWQVRADVNTFAGCKLGGPRLKNIKIGKSPGIIIENSLCKRQRTNIRRDGPAFIPVLP